MTNPRTVTRFIEQRVTLGQIAYEEYRRRRRVGILFAWSDLDDESRAEWEAAADAVADAIEDTRADEPPVQRIEPKSAAVKVDGADFIKELDALLRRASEQSGTPKVKPQTYPAPFSEPTFAGKSVTFGSPRPGFTFGTYEIDPTKAHPVAKVGETVTTPLPPSAFPGAEPFIPSDS